MEEKTTERVGLLLKSSQMDAVDDWRAMHRPPLNRNEALRRLIELGLEAARAAK